MPHAPQEHVSLSRILSSRKWPPVEFATLAVYHSPRFFLAQIDRVQSRLLDSLGMSSAQALREHRLAPLNGRRDMAMLGLLHRVVIGTAPMHSNRFFYPQRDMHFPRGLRSGGLHHTRQMHDPIAGSSLAIMSRSIFGLIYT